MSLKPLIVLVHGALTDASVWNSVAEHLQRSLHADAEFLSSILTTVEGPFVLVGHSYGGSVISHPILTKHALKSLVFVSASLLHLLTSFRWSGSEQGLNLPI